MPHSRFLDEWLERPRKIDWDDLATRTIKANKWDLEDIAKIFDELPEFEASKSILEDRVVTGEGAAFDTYFSFFKHLPLTEAAEAIRPDHIVNAHVRDMLQKMREYAELRALGTCGDDVNAALAFMAMRDDLITLFDRLKAEQELAQKLAEKMQEYSKRDRDVLEQQDQIDELRNGAGEDGLPDDQEQTLAEMLQALEDETAAQQAAADAIRQLAEQLETALEGQNGIIRHALTRGLASAKDSAESLLGLDDAWGTEPGQMQRLNARERLDLAKRIKDSDTLKELTKLIGPMKRVMFGQQRKQPTHAREEIYSVEQGDDISRLIPDMFVNLHHPKLKRVFQSDLADRTLLQYALRGTEKLGMGGIIACLDNSGSMAGNRELWGKAVALSLLHLARTQKRSFRGIHFSYAHAEMKQWVFDKPEDYTAERLFDYAETFLRGGTDFQTPLTEAVRHLREEYDRLGAVHGDIVFITDGECDVTDPWLASFKAEQEILGFQVFGLLVGPHAWGHHDVMDRICDGRVVTVKDLVSPDDVRDVFSQIHSF